MSHSQCDLPLTSSGCSITDRLFSVQSSSDMRLSSAHARSFFLALIMLSFKGFARDKIRIIYDNMSVAVLVVGMYCNDILILFFQQPMTQFLRYFHSLFGSDFIGSERLNYVLGFGGASPCSETLSDGSELFSCSDGFCLAHKSLDKRMTSGLIPVHDVFKAFAH